MTIKIPMDPELYEAAECVMEAIGTKLAARKGKESPEDILGRQLAEAYERWHSMLIAKYTMTEDEALPLPEDPPTKKRRFDNGKHPWRSSRAVIPKRSP